MTKDSFKIVSLIPSGTEILAALGLADVIVGRSHECDFPSDIKNIPACTQARVTYPHSPEGMSVGFSVTRL